MRSDMDHTVLSANYTMPAFTPQPQSITTLWLVLIDVYRPTEGRKLSWPGWLVTYLNKVSPLGVDPDTVTHPSTNRAQRRLTSLIETTMPRRQLADDRDLTCEWASLTRLEDCEFDSSWWQRVCLRSPPDNVTSTQTSHRKLNWHTIADNAKWPLPPVTDI